MSLFNKKKNNLKVVYDEDLTDYLKSLGLYEEILGGKHLCIYCGNQITIENIEVIVPKKKKEIGFICNNKKCLNQL